MTAKKVIGKKVVNKSAAKAAKKVYAISAEGCGEIGYSRYNSVEEILTKDDDIVNGHFDGHKVELWEYVGVYTVVPGARTLKEIK